MEKTEITELEEIKMKRFRGTALEMKLATRMVNKLESAPLVVANEEVQRVIEMSDIDHLREENGERISLEGKSAVAILPYKGSYIFQSMKIVSHHTIGKHLISISLVSDTKYDLNDEKGPRAVITEFRFGAHAKDKDNMTVPTLIRYVMNDDQERVETTKPHYFHNLDVLPVVMFKNNAKGIGDIEAANMREAVDRLNILDSMVLGEWRMTKTMLAKLGSFNNDDAETAYKNIITGVENALQSDSWNEKLQEGTLIIPASVGTQILLQLIIPLEMDIQKKTGMQPDTINSGSNQHNLEIITANEFGTEILLRKIAIREKYWQELITILAKLMHAEIEHTSLGLSRIEQMKLDLLDATIMSEIAKGQPKEPEAAPKPEEEE